MTGIEKISARIEQEARTVGEEHLTQARDRAQEIRSSYEKEAHALREELTEKNAEDAAEHIRRAVSVADLESRKRLLAAKQELIQLAFTQASEKLNQLPEDELCRLLSQFAAGASIKGDEKIVLSPADHKRLGKKVCEGANALLTKEGKPAGLTLASKPKEMEGGGLMLSAGEVEVNCTFATVMDRLRAELSSVVAGILFSG